MPTTQDVSAVVCTLNSIASIRECLLSLRDEGVGELIVVDAGSTDGTRAVARELADRVVDDPGTGLGNARNVGIAVTTKDFVLNMGSDNVMPPGQLAEMLRYLTAHRLQGVSAQTLIAGDDYLATSLNSWRRGRFPSGPAAIIGTPTLFDGTLLRAHPFDATRRFSDDSELCERWHHEFGAMFAISTAHVLEIGKTTWAEVLVRCRMYGISDAEVFALGSRSGWSATRKARSLAHPAKVDLVEPLMRLDIADSARSAPFLVAFTALRYLSWATTAVKESGRRTAR